MKLKHFLVLEEVYKDIIWDTDMYQILKNPTINELKKYCAFLKKNYIGGRQALRFIVNFETKEIYFWPSMLAIHLKMVNNYLHKEFGTYPSNIDKHDYTWYAGIGHISGDKIIHDTDTIKAHMGMLGKHYLKNVDDKWTEKYFNKRLSLEILDKIELENQTNESYISRIIKQKSSSEIFANPEKDELKEFEYVRFLIDLNLKQLYVWNAEFLHYIAENHLHQLNLIPPVLDETYIRGQGKIKEGKIRIIEMFDYVKEVEQERRKNFILNNPRLLDFCKPYFTSSIVANV